MKKLLAVLFTLVLLAGLAACGHFVPIMPGTEHAAMGEDAPAPDGQNAEAEAAFREQPLMDFLGWGSFASSYYDNTWPSASGWATAMPPPYSTGPASSPPATPSGP